MKKRLVSLTTVCAAGALATTASAGTLGVVDDFNDGIYSGWTTQNGTVTEGGGFQMGDNQSLATMDGMTGSSAGVDAVHNGTSLVYVAIVLNYTDNSDNLFVKLQDNNSDGLFDRVFFYHGNNGSNGIVGTDFFDLATPVASTYFEVTDNGDGTVSAFVQATGETFGGTLENTYTGTGVGLGHFGVGGADNFYLVPAPGALALLGVAGLVSRRRRRA